MKTILTLLAALFLSHPALCVGPRGGDPGVVLLLHSEEATGLSVKDYSGKDHTSALTGGTIFITSPFGSYGTYHDGNTDYLETPATSDYDFTGTTPFSIFLWAKPDVLNLAQMVWFKNFTSEANEAIGYALQTSPNGALSVIFKGGGASADAGTFVVSSNTWSRVGFTWDGTTIRLYVNANQVASGGGSGPNTTGADSLMRIASRTHATHQDFQGAIDEFIVYNYGLTPAQVKNDYQSFFPKTSSSDEN